jgi:hypothetical protein
MSLDCSYLSSLLPEGGDRVKAKEVPKNRMLKSFGPQGDEAKGGRIKLPIQELYNLH